MRPQNRGYCDAADCAKRRAIPSRQLRRIDGENPHATAGKTSWSPMRRDVMQITIGACLMHNNYWLREIEVAKSGREAAGQFFQERAVVRFVFMDASGGLWSDAKSESSHSPATSAEPIALRTFAFQNRRGFSDERSHRCDREPHASRRCTSHRLSRSWRRSRNSRRAAVESRIEDRRSIGINGSYRRARSAASRRERLFWSSGNRCVVQDGRQGAAGRSVGGTKNDRRPSR